MTVEDIIDAKVGSSQVSAIYLGGELIWPQVAYTYEILTANIYFSRGSKIDAGSLGSDYSGNYVYVSGTVEKKRDGVVVDTLYNVPFTLTLDNTTDFTTLANGKQVYGYNLHKQITTVEKTTTIYATYEGSDPFTVGTISQVVNTRYEEGATSTEEYGTPVTERRVVPDTYYVVLNVNRYTDPNGQHCPAYGGYAPIVFYGGHDEAYYNHTPIVIVTTTTYSYSSGDKDIDTTYEDGGYTPWEMVGSVIGIDDTQSIVVTSSESWANYNSGDSRIDIANAGTTTYSQPRSAIITATNGSATDSDPVYQQANIHESSSYEYALSVDIDASGEIPAVGGSYPVTYSSYRTAVDVYTSGTYYGSQVAANARLLVSPSDVTVDATNVSGEGSTMLRVPGNASGTKTITVTLRSVDSIGASTSDTVYQGGGAIPAGQLMPVISSRGAVSIKWTWDSSSASPSYPLAVELTGLVFHYIYDGETTEHTEGVLGTTSLSFTGNNATVSLADKLSNLMRGTSGTCWFSASVVTGISSASTFPPATFTVLSPSD